MQIFDAVILGIIEGITEFLPISSTGHLIITSSLLQIPTSEFLTTFEIAIQCGAVLSVAWLYHKKLQQKPELLLFACIGFLPAAVIGALFHSKIKILLGSTATVGWSLLIGGICLLLLEVWQSHRKQPQRTLTDLRCSDALIIGILQTLALIPGVSRAAATIAGGLLLRFTRQQATEFSFLLSLPTIIGATVFDLLSMSNLPSNNEWILLVVGGITSFIFATLSIRWLLQFITTHTFTLFGWYRIFAGILILTMLGN